MEVQFELNGKPVHTEIEAGAVLLDVLRDLGCYSVKCGCETESKSGDTKDRRQSAGDRKAGLYR